MHKHGFIKHLLFLFAATLLLPSASWAQGGAVQGHLDSCGNGARVVIFSNSDGTLSPVDTIGLDKNGNFRIVSSATDVVFFVLGLDPMLDKPMPASKMPMLHVFLLPDEQIFLNMQYHAQGNNITITQVEGSANMEEYAMFNNMMVEVAADQSKQALLAQRVEQLIASRRENLMSAFLVTFFESDFNRYAPLYKYVLDALAPRYPDNAFVRYLNEKTRGMILPGVEAPDIVMKDRDGKERRLSDLRGKVVLLDFWASWCRPCRMENPNVVRLYHQYKELGFEVFSVSLDKSRDEWLRAIEADGLVWENHVSDLNGWTSSGGRAYGVSSIPSTFLIGPDGKILAVKLRGAELQARLEQIFTKR